MYYGYGGSKPGTTHKKLFPETNKHHLHFNPKHERTKQEDRALPLENMNMSWASNSHRHDPAHFLMCRYYDVTAL